MWLWRLVQGAWYVVTGICRALGLVLYAVCTVVEAMAMIFLLASLGGRR